MDTKFIPFAFFILVAMVASLGTLAIAAEGSGSPLNMEYGNGNPGDPVDPSTFTVSVPGIRVEPQAAWPGEEVVVTGTGFHPNTQIQEVSIGDAPITWIYELGLTDWKGEFEVTGIVPGVMPGTRLVKVRVTQLPDSPITTEFVVLGNLEPGTPSGPPQIDVEPDSASPGEPVTVWGFNFTPFTPVQEVSISGAPIVSIYELPITSATGSFKVVGTVPGVMAGGNPLKVRVTQPEDAPVVASFLVLSYRTSQVTVEDGFSTIEGIYNTVWAFDADAQEWMVYDTTPGAPDDFDFLTDCQGYWVEVTEDCALTYGANTWNLNAPWNLIGWLD